MFQSEENFFMMWRNDMRISTKKELTGNGRKNDNHEQSQSLGKVRPFFVFDTKTIWLCLTKLLFLRFLDLIIGFVDKKAAFLIPAIGQMNMNILQLVMRESGERGKTQRIHQGFFDKMPS